MNTRKIPLILFLIGILFIGMYGLILSTLAVIIQIPVIEIAWRKNPSLRQTQKYQVGLGLFIIGLLLFGAGLYQVNEYFGGLGLLVWIAFGIGPFIGGSLILLLLPVSPKQLNKKRSGSKR